MISQQWDDQYASYDFRPFGGECRSDVLRRHLDFANYFLKTNASDVTLLVGHGRGLATLLSGLGYPPDLKRGEYKVIDFT